MRHLYKIMTSDEWAGFKAEGLFTGSAVDLADGFIHLSYARQVRETARRHFLGQSGTVLLALSSASFGEELKAEASRGGDFFPHLYASFSHGQVLWARALPLGADGSPDIPDGLED